MDRLVIENATLAPMAEEREVIPRATVVAEHGTIVEVAREKRYPADLRTEVIDARERVLMPGLVNAHTHLYQVLLRGVWDDLVLLPWLAKIYGVGAILQPDDCYAGARLGALESLASGVTTVCDHIFLNATVEHTRATIAGMQAAGIRAVAARAIMDSGTLPPACVKEEPGQALAQVSELTREYERDTATGMLSFMVGPNTPPLNASTELVTQVAAFAVEKGLGVSTHVAESEAVARQCREDHGQGVVEYLDSLGLAQPKAVFAHCVHVTPAEIRILAARGVSVAHNPVSNCMLADGVAPVAAMLAAGVNVALGTDGAASNHTQDMFEVMKLTSLLQRVQCGQPDVISPYQILRMATTGGAHALGLDDQIGTVQVGKRADLILVNPFRAPHGVALHNLWTHLVHTLTASDVEMTIVDGRVRLREGVLVHQDLAQVMALAQQRALALVART